MCSNEEMMSKIGVLGWYKHKACHNEQIRAEGSPTQYIHRNREVPTPQNCREGSPLTFLGN